MHVDYAQRSDREYLAAHDRHVTAEFIDKCIDEKRIVVVRDNGQPVGWLRFGYMWDVIPFMNMLWVDSEHRRQGVGRRLVEFWESEMQKAGHRKVMTSSQADEDGQHFYRKLEYKDCGGFVLPGEPLEVMFYKEL